MKAISSTIASCIVITAPSLRAADWTQFAGNPHHIAVTTDPIGPIDQSTWTRDQTDLADPIQFYAHAGCVTHNGAVYALAYVGGFDKLLAFDRFTGAELWQADISAPIADSWSSPVVDAANNSVIVGSDLVIAAFDAATGAPLWTTVLCNEIINATPVITDDLGPADRLFIVDADPDGAFGGGILYCINVDPFDAQLNPHQPGDIVWQFDLNATTEGSTPAYHDGVVYVADSGAGFGAPGNIRAFTATGSTAPASHIWMFTNIKNAGFFGGVVYEDLPNSDFVYAASYAFYGQQFSANLVKLDAATGIMFWSADSNRTDSIPIPLGDGRVVLSTGIASPPGFPDFGSRPSIQLFQDNGATADLIWDSALDTWNDANGNSVIDPGEYLAIGGWTHQPVFVDDDDDCPRLIVGAPPTNASSLFDPNTDLLVIDLDLAPSDAGFIIEAFAGAGGSPAVVGNAIYSVGTAGLVAFDNPAPNFDVNGDGSIDIDDLYDWYMGNGDLDINGDGVIDSDDVRLLIWRLRKHERIDMLGGRWETSNIIIP